MDSALDDFFREFQTQAFQNVIQSRGDAAGAIVATFPNLRKARRCVEARGSTPLEYNNFEVFFEFPGHSEQMNRKERSRRTAADDRNSRAGLQLNSSLSS